MKTLLFVSKNYGAQKFVTYSENSPIAIVGNSQASKIAVPSPVKHVTMPEVNAKIDQLYSQGVKLLDSCKDSYSALNNALRELSKGNFMTPVKNIIYINQYGYSFVNPAEYDNLLMLGETDTSKQLFIDGDRLDQYGEGIYFKSYQLKAASRSNFKPLYFNDRPGLDNRLVLAYLAKYHSLIGHESIKDDYTLLSKAIYYGQDHPLVKPDIPAEHSTNFNDIAFWSGFGMSNINKL